jgi:RimJ/RimL family protein N-acetyltransferase
VKVALRPATEADLESFYQHQADPVAADMAAFPSRDREAHFAHWRTRVFPNPDNIAFTVLADGAVAGNVVSWIDDEHGRLVGYWLGRDFWGRGIATEALRQFIAEVTDRPLYAYVATNNVGSARVLEKAGFTTVGDVIAGHDGVDERLFVLSA